MSSSSGSNNLPAKPPISDIQPLDFIFMPDFFLSLDSTASCKKNPERTLLRTLHVSEPSLNPRVSRGQLCAR